MEIKNNLKRAENQLIENTETIKDFPVKGVIYRDLTTILRDKNLLDDCIDLILEKIYQEQIHFDLVAGIESRGFIFGAIIANDSFTGFVPIRKKGKLPRNVIGQKYFLEYGEEEIEIHPDDVKDKSILIVDDVLATGGTMEATCKLIELSGGKVAGCVSVLEIEKLEGRKKLKDYKVISGAKV